MSALALASSRPLPVVPITYPSAEARRHFFAVCNDAHANLPAAWAEQFRSARGLRQHCLIRVGYCTHTDIVCESDRAALSLAAQVRPSKGQDYCMVTAYGPVVTIFEAKSQSAKALPAREFFELRDRIFTILADMIGVDPVTLRQQAGGAA